MGYVRRSERIKHLKQYKDIRLIFKNLFDTPNFTDNIVYGASFKWYFNSFLRNKWGNEKKIKDNVKNFLENNLRGIGFIFEVKLLPHPWASRSGMSPSFRILTRLYNGPNSNS
jgi:hypothetical protein